MPKPKLGRLESVELREAWKDEGGDFTPWLAEADNLKLLGDTVGIELALQAREKEVGPYRADLLCKEVNTDHWVVIENQLERTDHSHLGQILTYAAGLDAVTIIWIARQFTEEHRAALDWLNENTSEQINLFGLEVELWRIGDSPVAPKFNIVCKPNDWSRTIKQAAQAGPSAQKQVQLEFWTAFADYMKRASAIKCPKPLPQNWMSHAIGRSGFALASIASFWNNSLSSYEVPELRVELTMTGDKAKDAFAKLQSQKAEIEQKIGVPVVWHSAEGTQSCRVYTRTDGDFRDRSQWPAQHEWLKTQLERFRDVFQPLLAQLG